MTANALQGDRERCLEAGMDRYVAKPVDREQLFQVMVDMLVPALPDAADPEGAAA